MEESLPAQPKKLFYQIKKKKAKINLSKPSSKLIINNNLLPDGNEDEEDEEDVDSWAEKNVAFISGSQEWGNHLEGKDWIQNQRKIHQSQQVSKSQLTKNHQKDNKVHLLEANTESPLLSRQPNSFTFIDAAFPANQLSLTGEWGHLQKYKDVYWKIARQQLVECTIFNKRISPKDIVQGKLGDCYFLASLAALAERPDRIFNLFLVSQLNQRKYLSVKMLFKGKWTVIDLDQHFPFASHQPIFSHAVQNVLWVMILQKAWAKMYSSYMRISAGHTQEPLHDLTGAPIKFVKLKDKNLDRENLWKYLMKASRKQYAMCASSNKGSDQKMSETGIVQGHAYTILNATYLKYQGSKVRLIQLRNPWGKKENNGNWGDKDPRWKKISQEEKNRLRYESNVKDGIFYMQFEEFLSEYRAITVAEVNDNASYIYQSVKDPNTQGVYFKVELHQTGHYSFQIDKTCKRCFDAKRQMGYKYPLAMVKVFSSFQNYKQIHHFEDSQRLTSRRYSLFKGLYIVYVRIAFDINYEKDYDVTLAIYSECPSTIQVASKKEVSKVPPFPITNEANKRRFRSISRPRGNSQEMKVTSIRFNYLPPQNYTNNGQNQEIVKNIIQQNVNLQIKEKQQKTRPIIHIGGKVQRKSESQSKKSIQNIVAEQQIQQQTQNEKQKIEDGIGKDILQMVQKQVIFMEPCPQAKTLEETKLVKKDFVDQRFPPSLSSLSGEWGALQEWKNVRWQKISKTMPNSKIFQGKVSPQSIKQGFLGDCYFLAGIAALAERPDRIFNLFLERQRNQSNSYSVKMLYRGKWLTINMDEYIPYMYDLPAFSRANKDELWVIILEKAWAKIYSSFKRIQAGFPEETLHDLTGAPIRHIYLQRPSFDKQKQWKYLMDASAAEFSMVASSQAGSDSLKSVSGIVQGHAYTLLQVIELMFNNRIERLVQLRNPWGKGESVGKWSDSDPNWNLIDQKTKQRLGYAKIDDGIFFMSYESFCQQFKIVTVAEINDNASYVYKSAKDPKKYGCFFKVQILQKGRYSFQVDSTPERTFEFKYNTTYRYPNIKFELGMLINNGYIRRMASMQQNSRTSFYAEQFQPGFYLCFVRIDFDANFEKDFDVNLAIYGDYVSNVEYASKKQAVLFSGDPNVKWGGQELMKKPEVEWNALRSYRPDRK